MLVTAVATTAVTELLSMVCSLKWVRLEWCLGVRLLTLLTRTVTEVKPVKLYSVQAVTSIERGDSRLRIPVSLRQVMNLPSIIPMLTRSLMTLVLVYGMLTTYVTGPSRQLKTIRRSSIIGVLGPEASVRPTD